jgi:hypothetical protein
MERRLSQVFVVVAKLTQTRTRMKRRIATIIVQPIQPKLNPAFAGAQFPMRTAMATTCSIATMDVPATWTSRIRASAGVANLMKTPTATKQLTAMTYVL